MPNVQAFIRRAASMADKTSWTKPLACMTYGDSIAGTVALAAGTGGGAGAPRKSWRPFVGASTRGDEGRDGVGDASPGSIAMRAQRKGVVAGSRAPAPCVESR